MRYRFLEFVLDADQQTLAGPAGVLPLRRQSFRVLQYLVEQAPAVVGKDEILDEVWGHQSVSSSAVAQTIRELRELLDDQADHPRLIETRHRVGYRFIAEVARTPPNEFEQDPIQSPPFVVPEQVGNRSGKGFRALAVAGIAILFGIFLIVWQGVNPAPDALPGQVNSGTGQRVASAMGAARYFDAARALRDVGAARAKEDHPRLALWLAHLHILRGETRTATQIMAQLVAQRDQLQRGDQLMLDALESEVAGRYVAALDAWRILFEMDPNDIDVGLALFDIQIHERAEGTRSTFERLGTLQGVPVERQLLMSAQLAGLEKELDRQDSQALATIVAAGSRWPALSALARIESGRVLRGRGEIGDARKMFDRAVAELQQVGLERAELELRLERIDPALAQGDLDEVGAELESLQERVEDSGDAYSAGRVLHARGRLARRTGNNEQAIAFYAAAARQHESVGNQDGVASALGAQAGPLKRSGRAVEARAVLDRALRLAESSGTRSVRASIHGNLANLAASEARYADARQHYEEALGLFRGLHDQGLEAATLGNLANLAVISGDLRTAEKLNRDALALFRALDQSADVARILIDISAAELEKGDLAEAGQLADEAAAAFRQLGNSRRLAVALALGSDVKIHAAELDAAETLLNAAASTDELELDVQAIIATLHGRIALLRDKPAEARKQFDLALGHRSSTAEPAMQQVSRLDLARVDLAEGHLVDAEQAALEVAVKSLEIHQPSSERSARILLAEILLQQKRTSDAERELVAARRLLDSTPQFDDEASWTLLRAQLDSAPKRMERLEWLIGHAREHGQSLLEYRASGALYVESGDPRLASWREQMQRLGLFALLRPRLMLGP